LTKVVVTGSRHGCPYLKEALDKFHGQEHTITELVQGEASGVDTQAKAWATAKGIPVRGYPADWSQGRRAGPMRNRKMLEENLDAVVLVFPGGAGTKNCEQLAYSLSMKVIRL